MKCVLLCAGRGTRLGTLTRDRPKALLDVGGKPLVAHSLTWLAREGVTDVLINLHHLPDAIPAAVGTGESFGLRVVYSLESELLGTAGTVRAARNWIGDVDVLVVYGDVVTDQPLAGMWEQHQRLKSDATLLLHRRGGSNSRVVMDSQHRITSFEERPSNGPITAADTWVNSGVQILSPTLIQRIPESVPSDLAADVYASDPDLRLFGWPLTGWRVAVDSPSRLDEIRSIEAGQRR